MEWETCSLNPPVKEVERPGAPYSAPGNGLFTAAQVLNCWAEVKDNSIPGRKNAVRRVDEMEHI